MFVVSGRGRATFTVGAGGGGGASGITVNVAFAGEGGAAMVGPHDELNAAMAVPPMSARVRACPCHMKSYQTRPLRRRQGL